MTYDLFHRAGSDYIWYATAEEDEVEKALREWYDVHPDEKLLVQGQSRLTFGEGEYGEGRFANDDGNGRLA